MRAEKGNERNGKVIRRGRRTSYVGEGSGTLEAHSECCLCLGHPGSASVLEGHVLHTHNRGWPCSLRTFPPKGCIYQYFKNSTQAVVFPCCLSGEREHPPQNLHPKPETEVRNLCREGQVVPRPEAPSFFREE